MDMGRKIVTKIYFSYGYIILLCLSNLVLIILINDRLETFLENITELDDVFGLDLNFDRKEDMKRIFENGLNLDLIRQECNMTDHVFNDQADIEFKDLNVATEAFIYAEMEKRNKFILMPLTNRFFRDSAEIYQFIEHYPNYYKAMNPNMPEFNGKPNPYYLKKGK